MSEEKKKSLLGKLITTVVIILIIIIAVIALLFFNLNSTIRMGGEHVVSKITGGETTIGDVDISLLRGNLLISDIVIKNPTKTATGEKTDFSTEEFFKLGKLKVKLDVPSIFTDTIHVKEVIVDAPFISYEKTPFSDSNHKVLMANIDANTGGKDKEGEKEKDDDKEPSKKVIIDHLEISNSTLNLSSCGVTAPIPVPTLTLKDLGKKEEGVKFATALGETFHALFTNVFTVVKDSTKVIATETGKGLDSAGKALKDAGSSLKDAGKSLKSKVKNLFD